MANRKKREELERRSQETQDAPDEFECELALEGRRGTEEGFEHGIQLAANAYSFGQSERLHWKTGVQELAEKYPGPNIAAKVSAGAAYTALGCKLIGFNPSFKIGYHNPISGVHGFPHMQMMIWFPAVKGSHHIWRIRMWW